MNRRTKIILAIAGTLALLFLLWMLKSIVLYIIIAAFVSLLGQPIVRNLSKLHIGKRYLPTSAAAGITLLLFWFLLLLSLSIFVPLLANQGNEISKINPSQLSAVISKPVLSFEKWVNESGLVGSNKFQAKDYVTKRLTGMIDISRLTSTTGEIFGTLGNILVAFFAVTFISFFFLKEKGVLTKYITLTVPVRYEENVKHMVDKINTLIVRYFTGIMIDVLLIIVMVSLGTYIVGLNIQQALMIGFFAGLLNVIPYIGPLIAIVFGMSYTIATHLASDFSTVTMPLLGLVLMVFVIVQVIDAVLFQPYIYGNSVMAHPLEIFLVIMVAANLAGVPGMVMAIPTYTILRVIAKEFFNNYKLINKITEKI